MRRYVLGTVVGVVVAFAVLMGLELVGHVVYPPPAAVRTAMEKRDYAAMKVAVKEYLPRAPLLALLFPVLGWIGGTLTGALAATAISRGRSVVPALIVGGLIYAGTIMTLFSIPHPVWMTAAGLIGVPAAALAPWCLWPKAPAAPGPQPYDMRDKNMAC